MRADGGDVTEGDTGVSQRRCSIGTRVDRGEVTIVKRNSVPRCRERAGEHEGVASEKWVGRVGDQKFGDPA